MFSRKSPKNLRNKYKQTEEFMNCSLSSLQTGFQNWKKIGGTKYVDVLSMDLSKAILF